MEFESCGTTIDDNSAERQWAALVALSVRMDNKESNGPALGIMNEVCLEH